MERERGLQLYELILRLGKAFQSGWKYPATTIVAVYFWGALNERHTTWACDPKNWDPRLPQLHLPSQDRMSKRLRSQVVRGLLAAVEGALKTTEPDPVKAVDSKPLTVSVVSKDAEATWGRTIGKRWLRGYKLHAVWGRGPLPIAWRVTGLNAQDGKAAAPLLERLTGRGYVLGDAQYDQNDRYDEAAAHGHQLLALSRCAHAGRGHRRQSPHRLRGLKIAARRRSWVRRQRTRIERSFGGLTCSAGGLAAALPAWIRGHHRVTLWVQAKLIINALRILHKKRPTLAMA